MTAEPRESPAAEAIASLEARWIFPSARSQLQATAGLVFAEALRGGVEPGPDDYRSYAQWLGQRPGTDSDAGA